MNNIFYFAYGSNMSLRQMNDRCPESEFYNIGVLKDYELCFPIISKKRNNMGVASIRYKKGFNVEGVLYKVSDDDIIKLDRFENININYCRTEMNIYVTEKESIKSFVYIAIKNEEEHKAPSKEYMDILIEGATENKLSINYISYLKGFYER